MLHSLIAEEEDVNGARLSQPGSHQSTGWHKPSDVEALDLKWRSNWKEQCFNDTTESAWTSYLAMLSPTCQNAAETKKNMVSVQAKPRDSILQSVAKLEQIEGWCTCLVGAYNSIREGAYMVKFKPKLLFFQILGGAFAPRTYSVPSPQPTVPDLHNEGSSTLKIQA